MAAMAFSGCVARVDAASDDLLIPRLIFGVLEDTPLHPERSFAIAPAAILPLFWLQVSQVLKHQDSCLMLCRELNNTGAHQMRDVLIGMSDGDPEVGIVLFV